jgi:hypothetical protein
VTSIWVELCLVVCVCCILCASDACSITHVGIWATFFCGACRTVAQQKHDEYLAVREQERLAKVASKSHRERVQEYNEKLSKLSEHHDIPKVGPG